MLAVITSDSEMIFLKHIFIDRQLKFDGPTIDLLTRISKIKGVSIKNLGDNKIKIYPCISLGTLVLKGGQKWVDGINIKAELTDNDPPVTKIRLLTTIRPEHFIIAGMFILFLLFLPLDREASFDMIVDWALAHLCFQLVARVQEELLIMKLTKRLKLVKM